MRFDLSARLVWLAAAGLLAGAGAAWIVKLTLPPLDPLARAAAVLPVFGAGFFATVLVLRLSIPGLRRR